MNVIYVTFSVINGYFNKYVILKKYRKIIFLNTRNNSIITKKMLQSISFFWTKVNILNLFQKKKMLFSKIIRENIYSKIREISKKSWKSTQIKCWTKVKKKCILEVLFCDFWVIYDILENVFFFFLYFFKIT